NALSVSVANVAPTLTVNGAASVSEGSPYTLTLSASDPGQDTISGWAITWGDGTVQAVGGNPSSVSHTYADGPHGCTIAATATTAAATYTATPPTAPPPRGTPGPTTPAGPPGGAEGTAVTYGGPSPAPAGAADANYSYSWSVTAGNGQSVPGASGAIAAYPGS